MKIEILEIKETLIREIEDFGFTPIIITRIFKEHVPNGFTLKLTFESKKGISTFRKSLIHNFWREKINAISHIEDNVLIITKREVSQN